MLHMVHTCSIRSHLPGVQGLIIGTKTFTEHAKPINSVASACRRRTPSPSLATACSDVLTKGVFSFENFWLLATVVLLFVFGKNYLIMNYLGLKDSSHDFSANCVISFFFVYI